ncbi:ABC transporter substrate-binding protein [Shewanella alkalitolerans]|uniref:ABC transporter substrate-binding protein n=1 Tax=Shewanella alkalitolerans TaxID=2864209 RepID=UPI001C65F221|nr:ABC transporter substrate-binding protein [Shewanella alkalitolerans]QYJ96069.1 ABC transporter substrate-binding protein [Shewanella alkalitolerans]
MKAKGIVLLVLVVMGLLSINWWGGKAPATEPPIKLKIATSTTPLSAPLIIARELELFKPYNLDIELIPLRGGHLCFQAMIQGVADLATSSETVIMFNGFQRSDFRLLASFVESDNDLKLLTLNDEQPKSITQLADKRIGMVKASSSEFFADAFLIISGHQQQDFQKVFMSPQALGPALLAGDVDAISVWEPFGYKLIEEHGDAIYQYPGKGIYNLSFNLVTSAVNARLHEKQHADILRALKSAQNFINQHPQSAKQIISDYLDISLSELEWAWNDYVFRLSLNNSLISNLHAQARWAIASGAVDAQTTPDFRLLLDDSALKQALDN